MIEPPTHIAKLLRSLDNDEAERMFRIITTVPAIIEAMIKTAGPDDAMIAIACALGIANLANHTAMSTAKMSDLTFEFVLHAVLERRKR